MMPDNSISQNSDHKPSLNTLPVYAQLRAILADRISSQFWKSGQALPNESLIAGEFHVSVGTVRKAMDELAAQGIVVRLQGRGTFVNDRQSLVQYEILDHIRDSKGGMVDWDAPRLSISVDAAREHESKVLQLPAGLEHVVRLEWIWFRAGRAMVLQRSVVPHHILGDEINFLQTSASMAELFSSVGVILLKARVCLNAMNADPMISAKLGVRLGDVVQKMSRTTIDIRGRMVELCDAWFVQDDLMYSCTHVSRSFREGNGSRTALVAS